MTGSPGVPDPAVFGVSCAAVISQLAATALTNPLGGGSKQVVIVLHFLVLPE